MAEKTGAMQEVEPRAPAGSQGGGPGLLLLYADGFARLPAVWPLHGTRVVVGREPPADLVLPVPAVSRVHAELVRERSTWVVRDLGSTNGTIVDGYRISEAPLEAGLELRIGDAVLAFVERDVDDFGHYGLDGQMRGGARRAASGKSELVGGLRMDRIAARLERVAPSNLAVLVLGESGTGKEVVAKELHRLSGRRGGFYGVNCAAIPSNLLESELFGYKRGAFSGADRDKPGLIRAAHHGTLLLDEIGDMPLDAQAKLLRVLQSRELYPLGSTTAEPVDVRIVGATHRDLTKLQEEGRFRRDLYARLNEYQLELPALRDRKEDLYVLARAFLARHGRPQLTLSFPYMMALLHYDWPYNVRELEATIRRAIALADTGVATVELLPDSIRDALEGYGRALVAQGGADGADDDKQARKGAAPREEQLRTLLRMHQGNVAAVGRELGKARMQVHRWLKRYGIELEDFRR